MKTYYALVEQDPGSALGVRFPDIPGCFSAADSEDDVLEAAQEALALYLEDADELPEPRSVAELRADRDVARELKAGAFLLAVPLILFGRKERYNVMLDVELVEATDRAARTAGVSRSDLIGRAVSNYLGTAAKVLRDKSATKEAKTAAASALTQRPGKNLVQRQGKNRKKQA